MGYWYSNMNRKKLVERSVDVSDWSDLRIFLAVVDGQTLLNAADILHMSQPTVGRRLAAFEARLGLPLFVRTGRRMVLTDSGQAILEGARTMEREMNAIRRTLDGQSQGFCGGVTISAMEGTGSQWLIPVLASLKDKYPDIQVELNIESRQVDLLGREADLALRFGRPSQLDLIARKLTDIEFGVYASKAYLKGIDAVERVEDLNRVQWVRGHFGSDRRDIVMDYILNANPQGFGFGDYTIAMSTSSPTAQLAAVRAGIGAGVLSHRWACSDGELVSLLPSLVVANYELWLVTHEGLRHSARIKAVADHIAEATLRDRHLFAPNLALTD
mgnify:CR=1 FL=1